MNEQLKQQINAAQHRFNIEYYGSFRANHEQLRLVFEARTKLTESEKINMRTRQTLRTLTHIKHHTL